MTTLKCKWTGVRPLIMHSSRGVDPLSDSAREIKQLTSKGSRKTTLEDHQQLAWLEWLQGLYWDEEKGPCIPTDNIERCIRDGAAKSRLGSLVPSVILISELIVPLQYEGPRVKEKLYARSEFVLRKPVGVRDNKVMRTRPIFPQWAVSFDLEYDENYIDETQLRRAMLDAGALVGLGDWRPKYGRFLTE